MPYLYVLFSRSDTWFSSLIYRFSPGEFTHAALALDRDLRFLYSFGRHNPNLPLPAGFVSENVHTGVYGRCGSNLCRVYRVPVSEEGYRRAVKLIHYMQRHADYYQYNLFGVALCAMKISHKRKARFFCSQFVAELLKRAGAVQLPKDPHMMRPADLQGLPELELIYEGPLRTSDCSPQLAALAAL